jgi:dihydroorotate dehydrogenase
VKLAPDLHDDDIVPVIQCLLAHKIDAAIFGNTTLSRDGVPANAHRGEAGGLSGRPLFARATRVLAKAYLASEGKLPLIGVGGIDSGEAALAKIEAGASLLQLYTGLVFEGPSLIARIKQALVSAMEAAGSDSLAPLIGRRAAEWSEQSLPRAVP